MLVIVISSYIDRELSYGAFRPAHCTYDWLQTSWLAVDVCEYSWSPRVLISTQAVDAGNDRATTSSLRWRRDTWPRPGGRMARRQTRSRQRSLSTPRTVRPGLPAEPPWREACGDCRTPTTLICIRSRDQRWNNSRRHLRHLRHRHLRRFSRGRVTLPCVPAAGHVQTKKYVGPVLAYYAAVRLELGLTLCADEPWSLILWAEIGAPITPAMRNVFGFSALFAFELRTRIAYRTDKRIKKRTDGQQDA